jgi:hypothetical protein
MIPELFNVLFGLRDNPAPDKFPYVHSPTRAGKLFLYLQCQIEGGAPAFDQEENSIPGPIT